MTTRRKPQPQKTDGGLLDELGGPLRDFVEDFKLHGKSVLEKVREKSPEKYLELSTKLASLVAALRPKPNELEEAQTFEDIGRSLLKSVGVGEMEMTDEMIEQAVEANDEFVDRLESIAAPARREGYGSDQARDFHSSERARRDFHERKGFRRYIAEQGL